MEIASLVSESFLFTILGIRTILHYLASDIRYQDTTYVRASTVGCCYRNCGYDLGIIAVVVITTGDLFICGCSSGVVAGGVVVVICINGSWVVLHPLALVPSIRTSLCYSLFTC